MTNMLNFFKKKEKVPTTELRIYTQGRERRMTVPVSQVDNVLMFMSKYECLANTIIRLARPYAHAASVYDMNKLTDNKAMLALRNSGAILLSAWKKLDFLRQYHDLLIWAGDYEINPFIFERLDEMLEFFGAYTDNPHIPDWQTL